MFIFSFSDVKGRFCLCGNFILMHLRVMTCNCGTILEDPELPKIESLDLEDGTSSTNEFSGRQCLCGRFVIQNRWQLKCRCGSVLPEDHFEVGVDGKVMNLDIEAEELDVEN